MEAVLWISIQFYHVGLPERHGDVLVGWHCVLHSAIYNIYSGPILCPGPTRAPTARSAEIRWTPDIGRLLSTISTKVDSTRNLKKECQTTCIEYSYKLLPLMNILYFFFHLHPSTRLEYDRIFAHTPPEQTF